MTRQVLGILALVLACFGLLTIAGWSQSGSLRGYREDLEYYNRKCGAERQSEEGEYKKDCQGVLYRTFDDPVALLTGALTIATVALFFVTLGLYRAATRQGTDAREALVAARKSAKAARRSAAAAEAVLVGAEAPFVFVAVELIEVNSLPEPDGSNAFAKVRFFNYGRTPAIIRDFYPLAFRHRRMPDPIGYPPMHSALHKDEVIPASSEGEPHIFSESVFDQYVSEDEVFNSDLSYWVSGQVRYADAFGGQYVSGFCFHLNRHSRKFYGIGGSRYNYRRRLTEAEAREAEASDAELPIRRPASSGTA